MIVAGVMSGSSLDGIDIAIVQFNDNNWKLLDAYHEPYPDQWVLKIKAYQTLTIPAYHKLQADYSYLISKMITNYVSNSTVKPDYISFHGHTLSHQPQLGYTIQIGNGGIISAKTSIPTITDFRSQDVALDGVGTPLAPLVDIELYPGYDYYLNIGGIANITIANKASFIAYDICPANQILNHFSNKLGFEYDDGGEIARQGNHLTMLTAKLQSWPYFKLPPPKSLDNNWIVNEFLKDIENYKPEDALHTMTNWIADHIADQVVITDKTTKLLSTGGGTFNIYLMEILQDRLKKKNCDLIIPDDKTINFKEAILMALLGKKYLLSQKNVLKNITNASSNTIGGALYKVLKENS